MTHVVNYQHLLGIEFSHGDRDCYDILRRLYKDNLNMDLTNYARPDDWWLMEGVDLYRDNFMNEGFSIVENFNLKEVRLYDVFLIALPDMRDRSVARTNHCAIYVGDGKIIHHRLGKLSQVCNYGGAMKNFTTMVVRHQDVPDYSADTTEAALDLMDYVLPHKRAEMQKVLQDEKIRP